MRLTLLRHQRGDTIIEVLIAVAVASLVLVSSFAVANASSKQIRMAQERGEAQKIAADSVENLKSMVATLGQPLNSGIYASPFCIAYDAAGVITGLNASSPVTSDCKSGTESRYLTSITRIGVSAANDRATFSVKVSWDNLNGNQDNATLNYRVTL